MSVKSSLGFFFLFFFFFYVSFSFFSILPFKKYQFHKRYVEVFVCCFFVSVCVCLHVEKHLYSSVGKKGYVWNLSLPLFCPPPSFRWAWWSPGSGFCQLSEGLLSECKRRHRLLFSCRGMDTHFLWACERKNGVLFSSWIVFFFFFPLLLSCNNSLLVFFFFSDKVSVNRGMTWRAHCLVLFLCYKVEPTRQLEDATRQGEITACWMTNLQNR